MPSDDRKLSLGDFNAKLGGNEVDQRSILTPYKFRRELKIWQQAVQTVHITTSKKKHMHP